MSKTVVARLSRIVGRRASRRGFLARTAVGATAMAVAPAAFSLRPTTAHAAIVGGAGTCSDGYTDFCCYVYGENLCPPNTLVAGWWRADGSGMCDIEGQRRPRYYLDCNHVCDPGCGCGGAGICTTSCTAANCRCAGPADAARKVDCTRFRYGQCNQDVPCVGAIACRIVTCVPPWQWDPSCSTASARDNNTRFHDRPCLHDGFTDVAPVSFYTEAVEWAVSVGVVAGYNGDLFGPNESTTRGQFAAFLWRLVGSPDIAPSDDFDDVPAGAFYAKAVAWMVGAGITEGSGPRTFSPDESIDRAAAVTFLWRLTLAPDAEPTHSFVDVPGGAYFATAVAWAYELGITRGVSATEFDPGAILTRAEAVTFLHRYQLLLVEA